MLKNPDSRYILDGRYDMWTKLKPGKSIPRPSLRFLTLFRRIHGRDARIDGPADYRYVSPP